VCFLFSSRRRHTRCYRDWSSDVCSSDLCDRPTEARLASSYLSGCFSTPPDVVFSKGGRMPTFPRLCGPVALWVGKMMGRGRSSRGEGRTNPSKTASVAARLWDLMREPRGKHHMLGFA